jgi:hypothetical protein
MHKPGSFSSRSLSLAAFAVFGMLVAAPRASSQATETPTESPTATPIGSATATPTSSTTPSVTETPVPQQSPTAAPTETPTPRPTVPPTPFAGGSAGATSVADDFGTGGDTVDAGKFEVRNTTDETERITSIEIQATDPEVVSSLSLNGKTSGASLTATVASPATNNVFLFDTGLEIPPGETATFSLSGVIASQNGTTSEATATPGSAATSTPGPTATQTPDPFALSRAATTRVVAASAIPLGGDARRRGSLGDVSAVFMLLAAAAANRSGRRRTSATLFLLAIAGLIWMNALPGCGSEQPTQQTVGRIHAETDSGPVFFTGVPFSLGTVSRPQNLVFPGAAKGTASPTP